MRSAVDRLVPFDHTALRVLIGRLPTRGIGHFDPPGDAQRFPFYIVGDWGVPSPVDPVSRNRRHSPLRARQIRRPPVPSRCRPKIPCLRALFFSCSATPAPPVHFIPLPRRRSRIQGGARGKRHRELRTGRFPVDDDASTSDCDAHRHSHGEIVAAAPPLQSPPYSTPLCQSSLRTTDPGKGRYSSPQRELLRNICRGSSCILAGNGRVAYQATRSLFILVDPLFNRRSVLDRQHHVFLA